MPELNLSDFSDWAIEQIYLKLYPLILKDFMSKSDCQMVHMMGNMVVIMGQTELPVTHKSAMGGQTPMGNIKKLVYSALSRVGAVAKQAAYRTGTFNGRTILGG